MNKTHEFEGIIYFTYPFVQFSSVQLLSHVRLFAFVKYLFKNM